MRYMATVLDKASPIQQRTDPSEDLRTIIGRAFLLAQTAANMGGSVSVDVWEESGDASKNPWAKIGQVAVNFARVPSLLLRSPIEATATLALGNGKPAAGAPPRVACPYCDGVMDLKEDLNGIRYDYACAICQWESSYSPSQAADWLRKWPIRNDGGRLAQPVFDGYDQPKKITALASFRSGQNLALLVHIVKSYGEDLKVFSAKDGKVMGDGIRCRKPEDRAMALGLAKRYLEVKLEVEIHDQALHSVESIDLWATPPRTKTSIDELKEIIESGLRYAGLVTTSGKTIDVHVLNWTDDGITIDYKGNTIPVSELAQLRVNGEATKYGENVKLILWQNPDWDPDAKPAAKGKGKKAAASEQAPINESVACSLRVGVLEEWLDIYNNDGNATATADELNDKTVGRTDALYAIMEGQSVPDGVPADDEDLLGAWRALYPERALGETVRSMRLEDHEDWDSSCCREA